MDVCLVCLVRGAKLHNIENCSLKESFEALTDCLLSEDGLPKNLCWECHARLVSCTHFRAKALRSRSILSALAPIDQNNMNEKLESIDRTKNSLVSTLISKVLDTGSEQQCTWIEVKIEPPWEVHVKEERESECEGETSHSSLYQDHVVKPELVLGPEQLQVQDIGYGAPGQQEGVIAKQKPLKHKGIIYNAKSGIKQVTNKARESLDDAQKGAPCVLVYDKSHGDLNPTSVFICNECHKSFKLKADLEKHLYTHASLKMAVKADRNIFCCKECDASFKTYRSFQEHMESQHNVKYLSCNYCSFRSIHRYSLIRHLIAHAEENPYKCDHCEYKAARLVDVKYHLRSDHPCVMLLTCGHCSYSTDFIGRLRTHERTHTRGSNYKCDVCDYKTDLKSDFKKHLLSAHGMKPFQCNRCNSKCYLQIHERTHTGEKPFVCDLCEYKAARPNLIKQHKMTVHSDVKPFMCSHCNYTCSQKGRLQVHARTHTGEKRHKCDLCEYRSIRQGDLKQHSLSVQSVGLKPFNCGHCSYATSHKARLKKHEASHNGLKPYQCQSEQCYYETTHLKYLKRHMNICKKL